MKYRNVILLLALSSGLSASAQKIDLSKLPPINSGVQSPQSRQLTIDRYFKQLPDPLATLYGQPIKLTDTLRKNVIALVQNRRGRVTETLLESMLLQSVTGRVEKELLLELAEKEASLTVDQVNKEEALQAVYQKHNLTKEQLEQRLQQAGIDRPTYEQEILQNQVIKQYLDLLRAEIVVTDADLTEAYESHKERFAKPETLECAHILAKFPKDATADDIAATYNKVDSWLQRLKKGEDFFQLAAETSDCPSKKNGGRLGAFRKGQMVAEFEKAALALEINEISKPIETKFGVHLILKTGYNKPSVVSQAAATPYLTEQVKKNKLQKLLNERLKVAKEAANFELLFMK